MAKKNRVLTLILLVVSILSFSLFAVSCKKNNDSGENGVEKDAYYYSVADDGDYYVSLTKAKTYVLLIGGDEQKTGKYTLNESGELKLDVDGTEVSATINGDELAITYGGKSYTLLEKIKRRVEFYDEGKSTVKTVINGCTVEKYEPTEKEGEKFVGWYTTDAYEKAYNFAAPVRQDITVYARYVDLNSVRSEFTVTLKDGTDAQIKTIGGVAYVDALDEKDGKAFDGWYVSCFNDENKLGYMYNGEILKENVNFYPVWKGGIYGVTVTDDAIEWKSDVANSFKVNIVGEEFERKLNVTQSRLEFNFAEQKAGEYKIEITDAEGKNAFTVYYNNKSLARVSDFTLTDGGMLIYNGVENAEKYIVSVDCGNKDHKHTAVDNGTYTYFDISGCEMQKGGIKVTVKAEADGYVSSESVFVYDRTLGAVSAIAVDNGNLVWNEVANALYYVVTVNGETFETEVAEFSLKGYAAGKYDIEVYPVNYGYNSPDALKYTYDKALLATPAGVAVDGNLLRWKAVEGATAYTVSLNGKEYVTDKNELSLLDSKNQTVLNGNNVATVKAINDQNTSEESDEFAFTYNKLEGLKYNGGNVYWTAVATADSYAVSVNGGKAENYAKSVTSAPVVLNKEGKNEISVTYYNDDGTEGQTQTIEVTAYAVRYIGKNGQTETEYKGKGDKLGFPAEKLAAAGFEISGWYDIPDGSKNNGARYLSDRLLKVGGIALYANFLSKEYEVTLDNDGERTIEKVRFNEDYTLTVPTNENPNLVFGGWFFQPNGTGEQYTDAKGASLNKWNAAHNEVVLYANWINVFDYKLNGLGNGYTVSGGKGLPYVTSAKVAGEYLGKPIVSIDSLQNAAMLETLEIPDTAKISQGTSEGIATTALSACLNLKSITIFETNFPDKSGLTSEGGAVYETSVEGDVTHKELKFVPYGKTGTLVVADDATSLAVGAMANSYVSKVVIPSSVTNVKNYAFRNCGLLTEVEFLAEQDGEEVGELELGNGVFYGCNALTTVTLPGRLKATSCDITSAVDGTALTMNFDKTLFASSENVSKGDIASLETINVVGKKVNYSSVDGMLTDKDEKVIIYCPKGRKGDVVLPNTINEIGVAAFENCSLIEGIEISGGVEKIGEEAFMGCSSVTSLEFKGNADDNALTVCRAAFYGIGSVGSVTLPANLKTIEKHAFYSFGLTEVTVNCEGDALAFEDNAFGSIPSNGGDILFAVKKVTIGKDVPVISIAGVFGYKIDAVVIENGNAAYSAVSDGAVYNAEKTRLLFYRNPANSEFAIPEGVEEIDANVFKRNEALTTVKFPASLKKIGDNAFNRCYSLKTVEFAANDGQLEIGESAFIYCTKLTSAAMPAALTKIGDKAFYNATELKNITFGGNKLTEIGKLAFARSGLTEITLPEGLNAIGDNAFGGCENLVTVNIPATLEVMGENLFNTDDRVTKTCVSLAAVNIAEDNVKYASVYGVMYEKNDSGNLFKLIYCPVACSGNNGVVEIPETVEEVSDNAFYNNKRVEEIIFKDGADDRKITLGENLFYGADALRKITLPKGLEYITNNFLNGTSVEEITIPNTVKSITGSAFADAKKLKTVNFQATDKDKQPIPLAIEDGDGAFSGCESLTQIEFPERTTKIGKYAFSVGWGENTSLKTVKIPASVTELGEYAFVSCSALETVTFAAGSGLKKIPLQAFVGAKKLTTVTFPDSLESIEGQAFQETGLTEVIIPDSVKTIGNNAFYGNKFLRSVQIGANVTSIGSAAFESCVSLANVTFGSNVTSIGERAFKSTALTSVKLGANVQTIGAQAFKFTKLANVEFGLNENGVTQLTSIGDEAFVGSEIESFAFPETADTLTLGKEIFKGCSKLTSLHLSAKITALGESLNGLVTLDNVTVADANANFSITEGMLCSKDGHIVYSVFGIAAGDLIVPDGVQEIKDGAYKGQSGITKVVLPATVSKIGASAFASCENLAEVVFINGAPSLSSIGASAFENCTSLTAIALPENVTTIGSSAFAGCSSLGDIQLGNSVSSIGQKAFKGTAITSIELPDTLTAISSYLFDSTKLTGMVIPKNIKTIGDYAFNNCGELASVTFTADSAVTSIGGYAFAGTKMTSLTLPAAITSISGNMFAGMPIENLEVPENVTSVADYAFANLTSLKTVTFKTTKLKEIGGYAFYNCTALEKVEIPEGVTKILQKAFSGCTSLFDVKLPSTLQIMGTIKSSKSSADSGSVFENCTLLKTIDLPESLTYMGQSAFAGSGLVKIKLPSKLLYLSPKNNLPSKMGYSAVYGTSATAKYCAQQFMNCVDLEEVILPANLKAIGMKTFYNTPKLKKITYTGADESEGNCLPSGITELCGRAFANCGIETLKIKSLTKKTFNSNMFLNSSIRKIDLSECNVTSIGEKMFENASNLEEVIFSDAITKIEDYAFRYCESLKNITLPEGLTEIGRYAFQNSGIEQLDLANVATLGDQAFNSCESLKSIKINSATKIISASMFRGCSSLEEFEIPDGVTTIGEQALQNTALTTIRIPASVSSIGASALSIPSLVRITVDKDNTVYSVENNLLIENGTKVVAYPTGRPFGDDEVLEIPEGITDIAARTFYANKNAKKLSVPSTMEVVPSSAFSSFSGIEEVTLAEGVKQLSDNAFSYCFSLKKINIPSTLVSIGSQAFENCEKLETLDFSAANPDLVFASSALQTVGLTSVDISSLNITELPAYMFASCQSLTDIKLPENLVSIGDNALQYCTSLESIKLGDGVTSIGASAFYNCTALASIELSENVNYIGSQAFFGTGLTSFTLPKNVTEINTSAFGSCVNLTEFTIEGELTSIGGLAFVGTKSLTSFTVPASVAAIGNGAFRNCRSLSSITFEGDNVSFDSDVFAGCTSLESITLPAGINKITQNMFKGSGLKSITIPDTVYEIGQSVFEECAALTTVKLSSLITEIPQSAFASSGLTEITLPDSVRVIDKYAFLNCISLTSVTLGEGLCEIGAGAFNDCIAVRSIVIPAKVYSLDAAFSGWGDTQEIKFALAKVQAAKLFGTSWLSGCSAIVSYAG